jgi:hypothetical protein
MRWGREWVGLGVLVLASSLGGCAGEQIENSPSGGSPGVRPGLGGPGSANLPEQRGASRVLPTSSGCGPGPYLIPAAGTPTTERVAGDRVTDGAEGDVDCSVTASGPGYRVSVSLEEGPRSFVATATLEPVGDGLYSGSGSVGFYDPSAGNVSSQTCAFEVLANQEIGIGKAWGNVTCTQSMKEANPGYSCNFEGNFLVENCN